MLLFPKQRCYGSSHASEFEPGYPAPGRAGHAAVRRGDRRRARGARAADRDLPGVRPPPGPGGLAGGGRSSLPRRCALSLRHRELLILRITARCGAEYEWGVHVQVFAAKAGLSAAQVRSVTAGPPDDPCWTEPADRAVLRAADALDRDSDLSDADWASLVGGVGEEGAVDALLICGWYRAISYVARATRLAPEPGAPRFSEVT